MRSCVKVDFVDIEPIRYIERMKSAYQTLFIFKEMQAPFEELVIEMVSRRHLPAQS